MDFEHVYSLFRRRARKARTVIGRDVWSFRAQFFQSLRHCANQAPARSTTPRLGSTAHVGRALRWAIATVQPSMAGVALATCAPVSPPSASTFRTFVRQDGCSMPIWHAPCLSLTCAVVTTIACGHPCVSTARGRCMPDTHVPPSPPCAAAVSELCRLWASRIRQEVCASRPSSLRVVSTEFFPTRSRTLADCSAFGSLHTPQSSEQRCHCGEVGGSLRQGMPPF